MHLIRKELCLEDIQHDDKPIRFYRICIILMLTVLFEFLGPAVHNLRYWEDKKGAQKTKQTRKLDPKIQLFLITKLKLNFQVGFLALRISMPISHITNI